MCSAGDAISNPTTSNAGLPSKGRELQIAVPALGVLWKYHYGILATRGWQVRRKMKQTWLDLIGRSLLRHLSQRLKRATGAVERALLRYLYGHVGDDAIISAQVVNDIVSVEQSLEGAPRIAGQLYRITAIKVIVCRIFCAPSLLLAIEETWPSCIRTVFLGVHF